MLNHELVKKINSGRCFALVGSGPSCELGYPSWKSLAVSTRDHVLALHPDADRESYTALLNKGNYSAVFRQAEIDLDGRASLVAHVKSLLVPTTNATGTHPTCMILAQWPFACYLTTNFDDELKKSGVSPQKVEQVGVILGKMEKRCTDGSTTRETAVNLCVKKGGSQGE